MKKIISAGILWGTMGIFVRNLNKGGLETMEIVFLRALVTSILLGVYLLIFDRSKFKIKLKDLWCFIGTGILSIVFFNYCYFKTIQMTSMSVAAVLLYTSPVFVMVLSRLFFKEAMSSKAVLVLIMTFAGCLLVTGVLFDTETKLTTAGILVGLGAGLGYALYSIFSRFSLDRGYDSMTITFYTFLIGIVGAAFGTDFKKVGEVAMSGASMVILILLLGVVNTIIPYFLYTKGLTEMENSKAAIVATVEPVAATVFGILLFKEKVGLPEILGMALVLGGIVLISLNKKSDEIGASEKSEKTKEE